MKTLRSAFLLIMLAATFATAEDKLCVTKQWYGALALADMEQAIVYIYKNDTAALNRMMDDNRVGIFHAGTEVLIKKRYISKNGNNLIHIRKLGTAHELWTHMAAVACR